MFRQEIWKKSKYLYFWNDGLKYVISERWCIMACGWNNKDWHTLQ